LNWYAHPTPPEVEADDVCHYDLGLDFDCDENPGSAISDACKVIDLLAELGVHEAVHFLAEFSGSKGAAIRLPYQLFGQTPLPKITGFGNHIIAKEIAMWLAHQAGAQTLDTRIYAKRRQWRLTGTMHGKSKLWRTQLLRDDLHRPLETIRAYASERRPIFEIDRSEIRPVPELASKYAHELDRMNARLAEQRDRSRRTLRTRRAGGRARGGGEPLVLDAAPPCVEEALEIGIADRGRDKGVNRNDVTLQLACFTKDVGMAFDDAVGLLTAHALDKLAPFSSSDEAAIEASTRSCVSSVFDNDSYVFACGGMIDAGFTCDRRCPVKVPDHINLGNLVCPDGYVIADEGVSKLDVYEGDGGEEPQWERISTRPVFLSDRLIDEMGNVKMVVRSGERDYIVNREAVVLRRRMGDMLANMDLPVSDLNSKELIRFFVKFEDANLQNFTNRLIATRCGWHDERFILPGRHEDVHIHPLGPGEQSLINALKVKGDMGSLRRAVELVRPSNTAMMMLYASAAAPWLEVVGCPNFLVHSYYDSSAGKTIAQMLAASLWGDPSHEQGLLLTWNSTTVGVEYRAHFLSGLPFLLSEVKTIKNDKDLMKSIYMLAEGRGRIRGDRQGGTRKEVGWHSIVISTGESALSSSSEYSGIAMRCFELYGPVLAHLSGEEVLEVEAIARANYGLLGRKMIELMESRPELLEYVKDNYIFWRKRFATAFPGRFGHRMAGYAAMITIGGMVLHDWLFEDRTSPQEIFEVVEAALKEEAKDKGQSYAERALANLDSWVAEHRGHFSPSEESGWSFGKFTGVGVAILPHILQRACGELGLDRDRVVKDFDERNWLEHETGRKQKTVRLGKKSQKCYVINQIKLDPQSEISTRLSPVRSRQANLN